jgi:hypothetical protein
MSDGNPHTVKIAYTTGTLSVFIDDLEQPVLTIRVDLDTLLKLDRGMAWVGITAGTGGSYENHDILSWSFEVQCF